MDSNRTKYQSKLKNYLEVSGINNIEYIEIRESKDFRAPKFISSEKETRIFIAININKVRLIDNYKIKKTSQRKA